LGLALVLWLNSNRKKFVDIMHKAADLSYRLPPRLVIPCLLVPAVLVWLTAVTMPDSNLHVSLLNVGQGDAILIQKGNQQVLIDGGPSPRAIGIELGKQMPFWDRTIDLVVLTHPHADHLTGLVEVTNRYKVGQVLCPNLEYESPLYDEWLTLIGDKGIKFTPAEAGQQIGLGKVRIEVLNPETPHLTDTESDIDNNGVVLRVEMGELSFLLTADVMQETELELIAHRVGLTSTVLKVAHHGSDTSTCQEFLEVVEPRLAIISVGEGNPFGHPSSEMLGRLKQELGEKNIYRTDENGTIDFTTDGQKLWVRLER
jgi:competence protein ComEC